MATYVTKKCPHCGYAYQIHQAGEQRKYGCPLQICIRCQQSYWDMDIKEPALHGFHNNYEIAQSVRRGIAILLYAPMGVLLFGGGIFSIINGEMLGIFLIAMGGFITWAIGSHFKDVIYDKKHRDEVIARQQKEYDASIERLKDSSYLTALATRDSLAKKVLYERMNRMEEHYAVRPQQKVKIESFQDNAVSSEKIESCQGDAVQSDEKESRQESENKKGLSPLSFISFLVSVLGFVLYCMAFEIDVRFIFVITSIVSVVLPIVAKKIRLSNNKKGKAFEILSIIVGGFNFYCVIFALTQWPIFIAYLGWICCGVFYKIIK